MMRKLTHAALVEWRSH